MNRLRRRAVDVAYRVRTHPAAPAARRLATTAGRAGWRALPAPARARLAPLRLRPGRPAVPLDRFLLGDENGVRAADYAAATGDLLRPSTPIERWPHTLLLEDYRRVGPAALDRAVLDASAYAANARRCIEVTGHYFGARSDEEIRRQAAGFVGWAMEGAPPGRRPGASAPGAPVRVRPVRWSDRYQVVDGHHRLAAAYVQGRHTARVAVEWRPVWTPLARVLRDMSWIGGQPELYQPVDAPELEQWILVRRCTDRFEKMARFLGDEGLVTPGGTYLDVACAYGWFPARLRELGFRVRGIERDPLAPVVARHAYGLDPGLIDTGDAVALLEARTEGADVVSCFSLLHHFVLGRGSCPPERLAHLLDRATGRVLFLDTGQQHEVMLGSGLAGWDADHVERWLRRHTSFDRIVRLGPDQDGVGPFAGNYGRMLFACTRTGAVSRPAAVPGGS